MSDKKVELLKDHTHAGHKYARGALLTMNGRIADWLISQGVAKESNDSRATTAPVRRGCSHCGGGRVR